MKTGLFSMLFLFLLGSVYAQEGTFFYTAKWKECTEHQSFYKRVITKSSGGQGFDVKDYFRPRNFLLMEGHYSSLHPEIEEGTFHFYKVGPSERNFVGNYKAGRMSGTWKMMNKNNKLLKELHYDVDTVAKEVHMDTTGQLDKSDTTKHMTEQQPLFANDPTYQKMMTFIKAYIEYPPMAAHKSIEGKVVTGFTVEKDGSLSSFSMLSSPDKDLASEALRLVSIMPKWEPGKVNGQPVRVKMTLPIRFQLAR